MCSGGQCTYLYRQGECTGDAHAAGATIGKPRTETAYPQGEDLMGFCGSAAATRRCDGRDGLLPVARPLDSGQNSYRAVFDLTLNGLRAERERMRRGTAFGGGRMDRSRRVPIQSTAVLRFACSTQCRKGGHQIRDATTHTRLRMTVDGLPPVHAVTDGDAHLQNPPFV